jgi:predicted nucleic acid-binding protein
MMAKAVSADASTLIYLAKADAFAEIEQCVPTIFVPPAVWHEAVLEGERIGATEVPRIVEARALQRVALSPAEQSTAEAIAAEHRLGQGESEVLALGLDVGRAIVDEGRASRVATALGVTPVSTLFLPVLGRRAGTLGCEEAVELLRRLAVVAGAGADAVFAIEESLR